NTVRTYTLALTATQTVFDFAKFSNVAGAMATSKSADATLNAALQSLMTRVASAYFAVLRDEDNLSYSGASKLAYGEQLDQVKQQYKVGLKTVTDFYTAQASYDSAVASYIQAQTTLANDRENLRVITGKYYPDLAALSESFPLITPQPVDVETWVKTAQQQNWSIKSSQYSVDAARQTIRQQFGGHLPTINLEGTLDRQYTKNMNGYSNVFQQEGPGVQTDRSIMVDITVPLFEGGGVVAETNQAVYNYQVAQQQLEQTIRNTMNTTRQSYLSIIQGISQVTADKQAIKSNVSSLQGMEASYRVGTETLVDVLNQQQKLYQAQTQYAADRYAFVNNVLALKQAAGTLSFDDLRAINAWLKA
ncbi:MAG: type I secretion protein TolC, partial [Gammaproteobacteria bacterium]